VQELEAKALLPFSFDKPQSSQPPASKGAYSQVGYSYKGDGNEESEDLDSDDDDEEEEVDDDDKDFSSDDSSDERMESIAKEFGIKRYNWLVYMDKKNKEQEKRQKEIVKGDPSIKKMSRRERRKASQIEREKEREAARSVGRVSYRDPYREQRRSPSYEAYSRGRRSRSRSRSRSPSHSRRHGRGIHAESNYWSKQKAPRVEYLKAIIGASKRLLGLNILLNLEVPMIPVNQKFQGSLRLRLQYELTYLTGCLVVKFLRHFTVILPLLCLWNRKELQNF